jgi:hypothetical protein
MILVLALLALLVPRVTIALLWLFTNWFVGVFPNILWPLLGFIFLPLTTLWYSVVHHWFGGEWSIVPVIGAIIAVLIDISPATTRRRRIEAV